MESFFRYISYVDYYKRGEKIKNVGFLRWKLHNEEHRVEIQLKDVLGVQGDFEIKEKNTGKIIGEIKIEHGIGNFVKKFSSMIASGKMYIDTLDDRLYIDDVEGFLIQLSDNEYLSVPVSLEKEKTADKFALNFEKENLSIVPKKNDKDSLVEILEKERKERESEIFEKEKKERSFEIYKKEEEKDIEAASENVLIEGIKEKYIDSTANKKIKIIEPLHDDKWQQLCKEYPQVHPFSDKKVFLSIKPEDFIILQQGYQKLVHNSFMLHGFYNYGHMILGKLSEDGKAPVYVGVPGVYYEREKQAAQMFGFVGFESTEYPVQPGSYGYYMIEVEI